MKIALIDDHPMLTEPIKNMLLQENSVSEVRTYTSALKFLTEVALFAPDVVVTDLMMVDINGMDLIEKCRAEMKETKIVVLTSITDVQIIRQAIRKGANGFLSKASSVEELIDGIHEIYAGKQYIAKNLQENLVHTIFTEEQVIYHLSPREKDVLQKVCSGLTIKEIAYDLNLSAHTVQYYHRSVMSKLKVKRTADLIVFAMQNGLYIPDINPKKG
jgi:DNA-binding NarL/FixJ family response regulator